MNTDMCDIIMTNIVTKMTNIVNMASRFYLMASILFVISRLNKMKIGTEIACIEVCQIFQSLND